MSYQVLARKWRPKTFVEVVGQQHVLRALVNALDHDRMHHAYLFTGTRGVGKTTLARIFAKSLNCERGVSSTPCGLCSTCREVDEGRFVDLLEVDAASRTKVEDTRDLLENVQYAPTRGRYKVYLIDEVHMLSNHSFNALLKTLEEPPPHVKFLLATTDPQRLPVTILSRCLQLNLKRLPAQMIADHLTDLLGRERVTFELPAVQLIARAADGSMRDALSLLDQAIAFGGGTVRESEVRSMLGTIDREHVLRVARALAVGDAAQVLAAVAHAAEQVPDFVQVLTELLSLLHRVALAQVVPGSVSANDAEGAAIVELAQAIAPEDVQLFYQIGLIGRRDLPVAPDARTGLEMILIRMLAFRPVSDAQGPRETKPASVSIAAAGAECAANGSGSPAPRSPSVKVAPKPANGRDDSPAVSPRVPSAERSAPPPSKETGLPPSPDPANDAAASEMPLSATPATGEMIDARNWHRLVAGLKLDGLVRQLAANCVLLEQNGERWILGLATAHASLLNKRAEQRLAQAVCERLGQTVILEVRVGAASGSAETPAMTMARQNEARLREAQQEIEQDGTVRALLDTFNGRIVPNSIQPAD